MGVYYMWANRTRMEFVNPHDCGQGAKWYECSEPGTKVMRRLAYLFQSGRWSPDDEIEVISDRDDTPFYDITTSSEDHNLYDSYGKSDEEWAADRELAIARVGEWTSVGSEDDTDWDDDKAAILAPLAERYGWYIRFCDR